MSIYTKILDIMESVQRLQKDDRVQFGNTNYKALSEEKVTTIMRAEMLKHKMVVFPIKQEWSRTGQITHVDVTYKMVDTESGEEIEIVSCGDGADSQDKGSGKAMTYAFKYMWLRTFALPTGEDPDKISSEELDYKQEQEKIQAAEKQKISEAKVAALKKFLFEHGIEEAFINESYKIKDLRELNEKQHLGIVNNIGRFEQEFAKWKAKAS